MGWTGNYFRTNKLEATDITCLSSTNTTSLTFIVSISTTNATASTSITVGKQTMYFSGGVMLGLSTVGTTQVIIDA